MSPKLHRRRLTTFAAAVLALGCASNSGTMDTAPPAPSYPDVSGAWQGSVSVQGQAIAGTLEIAQTGGQLDAGFTSPGFGISASGQGTIDPDGTIRLTLDYNLECPGVADMQGTRSDDGAILSGAVDAVDCTGEVQGSFRFTR